LRYRSLLPNLAASALLLLGALNPVAVPRIADVKDVARKDTLELALLKIQPASAQ